MSQSQLSTPLTREQAYALVDAVSEREDMTLAVSAYEDTNGEWVFEATCDGEPDVDSFSELAELTLGGSVGFSAEEIDPDIDWVSLSQQNLPPVRAGGFFIHGTHDADKIPSGVRPILIDAAQAFGTGHHETTTGCLEAIEMVLKTSRPSKIIDVGTGTGVLAIALAMQLRKPIIASDIDPIAVTTASDNARQNNVNRWIKPVVATGLSHRQIRGAGPYDLLVANILARPLIDLAPQMQRAAAPRAQMILSGILTSQAQRVISAYRSQGLALKNRLVRGEWTTLILQKR